MANDHNVCTFVGRLGKDPTIKYLPSGSAVATFLLACGESWKDKDTGEKKEKTEWIPVVCFNKLAEIAGEYLSKGQQVLISGKMQTRSWDDKDGTKKYKTEIVANTMQMLGSKPVGAGSAHEGPGASPADDEDSIPF